MNGRIIKNKTTKTIYFTGAIPQGTSVSIKGLTAKIEYGVVKSDNLRELYVELTNNVLVESYLDSIQVQVSYKSACGCKTETTCLTLQLEEVCYETPQPCNHCNGSHTEHSNECCEKTPEIAHYLKNFPDGSQGYVSIKRYLESLVGNPVYTQWFDYITNQPVTIPNGTPVLAGAYIAPNVTEKIKAFNLPVTQGTTQLPEPFVVGEVLNNISATAFVKRVYVNLKQQLTAPTSIFVKNSLGETIANQSLPTGAIGLIELTKTATNTVRNQSVGSVVIGSTQANAFLDLFVEY